MLRAEQQSLWVGSSPRWRSFGPDAEVKGTLFDARLRYAREFGTEVQREHMAADLPPGPREAFLHKPYAFSWLPLDHMVQLDVAIIRHLMAADPERMFDFGQQIARYDLNHAYRLVLRLAVNPPTVLRMVTSIYQAYFRPGFVRYEPGTDAGHGFVVLHEAVMPAYLCMYGYTGYITEMMRMTGAENAEAEHVSCVHRGDRECRWIGRWADR